MFGASATFIAGAVFAALAAIGLFFYRSNVLTTTYQGQV
jgi:hypothetical protein